MGLKLVYRLLQISLCKPKKTVVQKLNSGENLHILVSIQKFDHLIIPFETDYLNSFEIISEDFRNNLKLSD